MAKLHVAFIRITIPSDNKDVTISDILSDETLTTSTSNVQSSAAPAGTTHAVCTSLDAIHRVSEGGSGPDVTSDPAIAIPVGNFHMVPCLGGEKVAAVVVTL